MSIRLPGLVSNSSWWAPFHEYSTTGRKLEGGELKGTHTHTHKTKNMKMARVWKYDYCSWNGTFYFTSQCVVSAATFTIFSPSGVIFVLDVDYYKDRKISSSSNELHGSLVVTACIKLAPREQGSGWTSLEGKKMNQPNHPCMNLAKSLHPGSFYTSTTFPLVRFYVLVCSKLYWIYNKSNEMHHMKTLNHIQ